MDFATFLIQCLNALQYGLLLFLVASGLTLIFGIMGVINLAHGSFYMIGAYMAYALAPIVGATVGGGFFTTLLLGLVMRVQSVRVMVAPPVTSVVLRMDGETSQSATRRGRSGRTRRKRGSNGTPPVPSARRSACARSFFR